MRSFFSGDGRKRAGFTLTEVLVYAGVFTVVSGLMVGVFSSVSRVQNRELAKTEIVKQSQFVMNAIKRAISQSSYIDIANDTEVSTLTLNTDDSTTDPIVIYLENGLVIRKEAGGIASPLSNKKVEFTNLSFVKTANPPGPDTVKIDFTIAYNTADAALTVSQDFRSAVARVSAVTFDSDMLPSSDNTYNVGASNPRWLNGFFAGNVNVGGLLNTGTASSDPSGQDGAIYYNTVSDVFRGYANGAWADLGGVGGGSTAWTTSGGNVYRSTGSVGIGTANMPNPLSVIGTTSVMSGNIGVGLTAPVAPLHIYKAGTGDVEVARFTNPTADENALIIIGNSTTADDSGFIVYDQSSDYMSIGVTGDSHSAGATLVVENGGMVGIGTTNPTALLEVGGASTYDGEIKVTSDAGLTATLEADDDGNYIHVGSSTNHDFSVVRNDKTMVELDSTGVIFKNVAGTTGVAIIEDGGNVGIGTTSATAQLDIKGNPTGGRLLELDRIAHAWLDDVGVLGMSASSGIGDDFFYIGDGTNQYMSILMDGGNVGIGTVNPNYVLEAMMEDNSPAINIAEKDVNNRRATMGFGVDSGSTTGWIMGQSSANNTTKDFYLYDTSNSAFRILIDSNGKVGIGTTSPTTYLHVNSSADNSVAYFESTDALARIGFIDDSTTSPADAPKVGAKGDDFVVETNNTEVMRIDSSGNVGIGTTSPSDILHVVKAAPFLRLDNGGGGYWQIGMDAGSSRLDFKIAGSDKMTLTNTGLLGIGTSSPLVKLDVSGASNAHTLLLRSGQSAASEGGSQILFSYSGVANWMHAIKTRHHSGQDAGNSIDFYVWDYGTDAADAIPTKHVMTLDGAGNGSVGIGTTVPGSARLQVKSSGTGTNPLFLQESDGGNLFYFTEEAGGDATLKMYNAGNTKNVEIKSNGNSYFNGGNVGIGTTAPASKLHIHKTDSNGSFMQFSNETTGSGSSNGIWFGQDNSENAQFYNFQNTDMYFGTNNGVKMIIKNTGNVGIGTTSPDELLHLVSNTADKPILQIENTNADNSPPAIKFFKNTASPADNDQLGDIMWYGKDNAGTPNTLRYALIRPLSADISTGTIDTKISFYVRADNIETETLTLNSGNVGIGSTAPTHKLDVVGTAGLSTGTAWTQISDRRVKQDIVGISDMKDKLGRLIPSKFKYTAEHLAEHPEVADVDYYGFIAQEFREVFPNRVSEHTDGYLQIDVTDVTPYLVAGYQEQQQEIEELRAEIVELRELIDN